MIEFILVFLVFLLLLFYTFLYLFIFFLCFLLNVHPNPAIHRLATTVKRLRLLPGVTILPGTYTGGRSLVPLITFYSVEYFIAGVRKHRETFYRLLFIKNRGSLYISIKQ